MRQSASSSVDPVTLMPLEFHDVADVAECSLDERLEQLQRLHAAANRAASRAELEVDLLESRDDIHPHILAQARRQQAAAQTRSQGLQRAIDALEGRLAIKAAWQ